MRHVHRQPSLPTQKQHTAESLAHQTTGTKKKKKKPKLDKPTWAAIAKPLAGCNIAVAGQYKDYPASKVGGWITGVGGRVEAKISKTTTHLVASGRAWERQDALIKAALKLNLDADEACVKIVSFDWLEDCLVNKSKKREGPYLWEKLDSSSKKKVASAGAGRKKKGNEDGARNEAGMLVEVLEGGTESYVDPREKKRIDRQIEPRREGEAADGEGGPPGQRG